MATAPVLDLNTSFGNRVPYLPNGIAMKGGPRIFSGAVVPVDGTSGTGVKKAGPGSMYIRTDVATVYINTGTAASPVWKAITHA